MDIKKIDHQFIKKHKLPILLILITFFISIACLIDAGKTGNDNMVSASPIESIDTFIPEGYTLVPLQIQNLASLDSIVRQYAVVNLYAENESKAVATGLKLIRSQNGSSEFSVLVQQQYTDQIARLMHQPLLVTVQNPKISNSEIHKIKANRIIWED